ncbi:unnamed protein product [Cochlearia groenlandica]
MDKALDDLCKKLGVNGEGEADLGKKKINFAPSQKWPYEGNSTTKQVSKGIIPSPASYDPMAEVDPGKKEDLDQGMGVYETIITPRDKWPDQHYVWLTSVSTTSPNSKVRRKRRRNNWSVEREPDDVHEVGSLVPPEVASLVPPEVEVVTGVVPDGEAEVEPGVEAEDEAQGGVDNVEHRSHHY